jgi:RND family efflux transporter MFP subunit
MTKKIIYLAIAIGLLSVTGYQLVSNKKKTENRVYIFDKEQPIAVKTLLIEPEIPKGNYIFPGLFEAERESKISSDIQGKIKRVLVDNGDKVTNGQILVELENSLLLLQLQSIEIQIEGLEADYKRHSTLAKADAIQGVQLEKTELALRTAKVQKATLIEQISKTTVRAPFDGIVTAKMTEAGSFAAPGMPLIQLTDISYLKLLVNVSEKELSWFNQSIDYIIKADIMQQTDLKGKLISVAGKASAASNFPVQFKVKNTADYSIKAGMSGTLELTLSELKKMPVIPASAIVGTNIKPKVYLVKNGKAYLENIEVLRRYDNKAVIVGGLKEGDRIVSNGFVNLYDGVNVTF